jgi:hypothetical protein
MKIEIVIQEDDLLIENTPTFWKETESIFYIDWDKPLYPRKGEDFDFSTVIPIEILDELGDDERLYLQGLGEMCVISNTGWRHIEDELIYYIDLKRWQTINKIKEGRGIRVNVILDELFPARDVKINWETGMLPRIGENFQFGNFITRSDRYRLAYFWIRECNLREEENRLPEECNFIWEAFRKKYDINRSYLEEGEFNLWEKFWMDNYRTKENRTQTIDTNKLNLYMNEIMDKMNLDIENIEDLCVIDQIIWSKKDGKQKVTMILRYHD